jgi:DNA-binding IclR family transcriptional regulator
MGLQTLDRAVTVLQALASGGEDGLRLIDLQHSAGLTKPTAHRLLSALLAHGLVAHDAHERRYRLGQELAILGWSVALRQQDLRTAAIHSASILAEATGDTVVVVVRSGFDTVCIDRRTGAYPIKALTVDVGTRRPIAVGAGGLAMLASLPPAECEAILEAIAGRLTAHTRASAAQLRAAIREARKTGVAVSNNFVTEGVRALSVAIKDFRGEPIAAIGIAAIVPRIPFKRIGELAQLLDRERRRIESRLLASRLRTDGSANGQRKPRKQRPR